MNESKSVSEGVNKGVNTGVRICIPTAGTGSRLQELTRYLNKSLVAIANRPTLCHLIEQCPPDAEFVIALGHKGDLVRQFLQLAYPERTFLFAEVTPFEGPGSGLGFSLLACEHLLQQPFIFMSCDTLVREPLPSLAHNWVAYAERDDLAAYRTILLGGTNQQQAIAVCEKGEGQPATHKAYIGLAGIRDHAAFWQAMQAGRADLEQGSIPTGEAYGLRALLAAQAADNNATQDPQNQVQAHRFTWYDTGNPAALAQALAAYREPNEPNILPKANEAIWFIGKNVVKFSDDASFIANRARRAEQIAGFVPALTGQTKNMYSYQLVEGDVLSERVNVPMFARLLAHCRNFWQLAELNPAEQSSFQQQCMKFYRNKTLERVDLYYKNFGTQDGTETQNGVSMPLLAELLQNVDWDSLARGLPGRFHGDFHFENIIVNQAGDAFTFLDWRQDFGGSISVGDIYYDFAKLMHGLIVNHELIAKDLYRVERNEHNVTPHIDFDFHRKQILVECERFFLAWLEQHGYDSHKVLVLTALIYLNIAALHHAPYCHLLYALGKDMLYHAQQTMSHSGNH